MKLHIHISWVMEDGLAYSSHCRESDNGGSGGAVATAPVPKSLTLHRAARKTPAHQRPADRLPGGRIRRSPRCRSSSTVVGCTRMRAEISWKSTTPPGGIHAEPRSASADGTRSSRHAARRRPAAPPVGAAARSAVAWSAGRSPGTSAGTSACGAQALARASIHPARP